MTAFAVKNAPPGALGKTVERTPLPETQHLLVLQPFLAQQQGQRRFKRGPLLLALGLLAMFAPRALRAAVFCFEEGHGSGHPSNWMHPSGASTKK